MLCQKCGKRYATHHLTKTVNGITAESHLCSVCAAAESGDGLADLFGSLFFGMPAQSRTGTCPLCGMTAAELARTGKPGCAKCYETFSAQLRPVLSRLYGTATHTGKVPAGASEAVRRSRRLAQAKKELEAAIAGEEFERAAALRDEIRSLSAENGQ